MIKRINSKMKSNTRQSVKIATKTSAPHSIIDVAAAASPKTLGVSKKSLSIQKKQEKVASIQRTLIAMKNDNGTTSLLVSKSNASIPPKTVKEVGNNRKTTERISRQKPTAVQVESKVCIYVLKLRSIITRNHDKFFIAENR